MTALEEIHELFCKLPEHIQKDIDKRLNDWFFMNEDENGPYIKQQLRYVKNVIRAGERNKSN